MAKHQGAATPDLAFAANEDRLVQLKIRTEKMEHMSRWIGMLLKMLFGLFWVLLIAALVAMAWRASGSRGIVIDGFEVTPSLTRDGITAEMLARRIRGRLTEMRGNTQSSRAIDTLRSDWIDDYRIEIPHTEITFSELNNALRRWLGSERRISGDVIRDGGKLTLTLRIGDSTDTVEAESIADLVEQAASAIYRQTDPYLFATYLAQPSRRPAESTAILAELAGGAGDARERAWALNGLANNIIDFEGRCADALLILAEAIRFDSELPNIYGNLRSAHACLGHDQAAADATAEELRRLESRPGLLSSAGTARIRRQDEDNRRGQIGDYNGRLELNNEIEREGREDRSLDRADAMARLYDFGGSMAVLRRWYAIQRARGPFEGYQRTAYWHVRLAQAWAMANWSDAARFAEQIRIVNERREDYPAYLASHQDTQLTPIEAIAHARAGEAERAADMVRTLPRDCYLCARSRAMVFEAAGNRGEADRWFRGAVSLAPRLPFAYAEWGDARLRRGDAQGALLMFDAALTHGPGFADAHKGRADALARLGFYEEAVESYETAAGLAPRWGALHLRWSWALARLGRADEARAKSCGAARLAMRGQDRALLARWLERARVTC